MPFAAPNRPLWAALLAATSLAGVNWFAVRQTRQADQLVSHTVETRRKITLIERDHVRAQALQRGFLITGRNEYLDGYETVVAAVRRRISELRDDQAGDHRSRSIEVVEREFGDAVAEMDETIQQMKAGMKPEAYRIVESNKGLRHHRRVADALDECTLIEDKLLLERIHRADSLANVAYEVTALFGIAAGVTVTLFYLRARRYGPG